MAVFFIIVLIVIISLLSYMWIEAHLNIVDRRELMLEGLPKNFDGFKLYIITDVHRRRVSAKMIRRIKDEADLVIIGGDLMEKGVPFSRTVKNIDKLSEAGRIFFVWGNNDYEVDFRRLDRLLRYKGVTILNNGATRLEQGGEGLVLIGVDDYGLKRDRLDLALKHCPPGFRILLSHNPGIVEEIDEDTGVGLVLSGHTHGGQIRLFGWGLREKGGVKHYPRFTLFISNGYGTTALPLRLGAPAECHLITLKMREKACLNRTEGVN